MNNNIFTCIFTCQTIAIVCGYVLDLRSALAVSPGTPDRKTDFMAGKHFVKRRLFSSKEI